MQRPERGGTIRGIVPRLNAFVAVRLGCTMALIAGASIALSAIGDAAAHGALDQALANDQVACDPFVFPASITQDGGQAQSFVPTQPMLAAVELCMRAESGPTNVTVRIRSGSADSPGGVLGGATIVSDTQKWEHVDFAAPIVLTPGESYVIELATDAGLQVTWYGNPHEIEMYADGESNATSTVRDFAFRTFASAVTVTPTATVTKTATPTKTRTPSATPTRSATSTPLPSSTTTVVPETATPPPVATEPPASGTVPAGTQATATRVSAVLGGARRTGTIRLPDVGDGASTRGAPILPVALALAGAGSVALAALRPRRPR
jgi:hypothetical protein